MVLVLLDTTQEQILKINILLLIINLLQFQAMPKVREVIFYFKLLESYDEISREIDERLKRGMGLQSQMK